MVIGKAKKVLHNAYGDIEKGMSCEIIDVWLNDTEGDVYVKVEVNGFALITSIDNFEIIK